MFESGALWERCGKTYSNSSVEIPSAAPKDRITVPIRITGDSTARSSSIRISNTTSSTIGMITLLSRAEAILDVEVDRRGAAHQGVGTVDCVHGVADLLDRVEGRLVRDVAGHRSRDEGDAVLIGGMSVYLADPLDAADGLGDLVRLVRVGDDHDRVGRVDQAVLLRTFWPMIESKSLVYCSSVASPLASSRKRPRQATSEDPGGDRPRRCADGPRSAGRPGPRNPSAVGSGEPNAGRFGQKIQRPKMTSSAGSSVTITSKVTATPIAVTGPRPAVEFISASVRQSMPTDDGRGAGEDGGRRAVQGERHRLVPVLMATELFSISRHQQQRVVGAGADHQDAQDRLALAVDGEVGVLGEEVDQPLAR